VADLADPAHFPELLEAIVSRLDGTLDALVNNAGIAPKRPDGCRLGVLDAPISAWSEVLCVNLLAAAALIRGLFAQLRAAGSSSVVNVTSIAGRRYHPFAGTAYACSKAALTALTREAATELAPFGIRVNAVSPGEIATTILTPGAEEVVGPRIPMGRLGRPEEVADVIFFLCSPEAGYLSGADLPVDGAERAS
jgi:NAD(P)-dependent dehydrogenase (short-subunit alcohol dehydrogenase family)